MPAETLQPASIMIVDDTPANLKLLEVMLHSLGYRVRAFPRGRLALSAAAIEPPELFLLDISMPEMDGYELCTQLKSDPKLAGIPVIFLSALSETPEKIKAFDCGGVDYVTKPFQIDEVHARVKAHLRLRQLQSQLERQNQELHARNERLRQLEQQRDDLTYMIVHDLRSPLTAVLGCVDLIEATEGDVISPKGNELLANARSCATKIHEIVNSLLDVSQMEAGQLVLQYSQCDLAQLINEVLSGFAALKGRRELQLAPPEAAVIVPLDRNLIFRLLQNLIANAIKFVGDAGRIQISIQPGEAFVRICVADNGPGIPAAYHARIFEKFGQVKNRGRREGTGLGLTFSRLAVEAHGGRIGVDSEPGKGSTFWFELPVAKPAAPKISVG